MNLGYLLEYLSEVGCGTWDDFTYAVATSEAAPRRRATWVATDLSALGHIEFDPLSLDWAICPPSLAALPAADNGTASAVLCGARSPAFLARTVQEAERLGGQLDYGMEGELVARMTLNLPDKTSLNLLAERVGITLVREAARQLAACTPTIKALLIAARADEVAGGSGLQRLSRRDGSAQSPWLDWAPARDALTTGVYRQRWQVRWIYWWKGEIDGARESRLVSKAVGLYTCLSNLLSYHRPTQTMVFPSDARPPSLHLRALVLCSGSLPFETARGRLGIRDVPPDVAETIMDKLGQRPV